jgi:hypothetical protein
VANDATASLADAALTPADDDRFLIALRTPDVQITSQEMISQGTIRSSKHHVEVSFRA